MKNCQIKSDKYYVNIPDNFKLEDFLTLTEKRGITLPSFEIDIDEVHESIKRLTIGTEFKITNSTYRYLTKGIHCKSRTFWFIIWLCNELGFINHLHLITNTKFHSFFTMYDIFSLSPIIRIINKKEKKLE